MNPIYLPEGTRYGTPENQELTATPAALERAMNSGTVIEGLVTLCDSAMRLHVDLGCAHGLLDPEEAVFCRTGESRKDIAVISRVGKPIAVRVTALECKGGILYATLSRRSVQADCLSYFLCHGHPGDVISAKVTHLEPFGAFLDIGCGVSSLLSVDCISVSRISHPGDRLFNGMELPVVIKSIDPESGRIYVTLRELLGTWEENAALFRAGETVTGIVRSVEPYGVFVELAPNLAGLAELKEGQTEELAKKIGQTAAVYIKSIMPERMKIKLVLIDVTDGRAPRTALRFFGSAKVGEHLSHWVYSPSCAKRLVESHFD